MVLSKNAANHDNYPTGSVASPYLKVLTFSLFGQPQLQVICGHRSLSIKMSTYIRCQLQDGMLLDLR